MAVDGSGQWRTYAPGWANNLRKPSKKDQTMSSQIFLEAVTCPRCQGHEFKLTTEEGSKGNAAVQGLYCTACKDWTTHRPRPPGLHLTQPHPATMGGLGLSPGQDPNAIPDSGPTDLRVWAWLLAKLLEETQRELRLRHTAPATMGAEIPPVYDHATRWLQRFHASEHGTPPQELIPAIENAAKGGG